MSDAPDIEKLMERMTMESDGNFYVDDNGEKVKVNIHTFVPETKMRDYTPEQWEQFRKDQIDKMRKIQVDIYLNRLASYNHWLQNNAANNRNDGLSEQTQGQTSGAEDITERPAEDPSPHHD